MLWAVLRAVEGERPVVWAPALRLDDEVWLDAIECELATDFDLLIVAFFRTEVFLETEAEWAEPACAEARKPFGTPRPPCSKAALSWAPKLPWLITLRLWEMYVLLPHCTVPVPQEADQALKPQPNWL